VVPAACENAGMAFTIPLDPDEVLTTTRTVRKRLGLTRPVPEALIRDCLQVALQAPSGAAGKHRNQLPPGRPAAARPGPALAPLVTAPR
jgi:nitroreductase